MDVPLYLLKGAGRGFALVRGEKKLELTPGSPITEPFPHQSAHTVRANPQFWSAAIGYAADDFFRIGCYIKPTP
jgi:hypothetical protein